MKESAQIIGEPVVGIINRADAICRDGERLVFVAKSEPFEKDGKKVYRVCHSINGQRQKEKLMCMKLGKNRKQFKRWIKKNRRME